VEASDLNGLPNGTTFTLDVDLNNDGNFTDAGESNYASGSLTDGHAALLLPALPDNGRLPWSVTEALPRPRRL
jgi:hypothetical protein